LSKESNLVSLITTSTGSPVIFAVKPVKVDHCIVWHLISSIPVKNHLNIGHENSRFQIDVFGTSLDDIETTASKIIWAVDNNRTDFMYANYLNGFSMVDDETNLYKYVLEFMIS